MSRRERARDAGPQSTNLRFVVRSAGRSRRALRMEETESPVCERMVTKSACRISPLFQPVDIGLGPGQSIDLQNLVPVVVDHLDRDAAGVRHRERARDRGVERGPRRFIDVGAEGAAEFVVGVVAAYEVGVADEELAVGVGGVDEPAGDVGRGLGDDFAVGGVVRVQTADFDLELALPYPADVDVGPAEDREEVAGARLLEQALACPAMQRGAGHHRDTAHRAAPISARCGAPLLQEILAIGAPYFSASGQIAGSNTPGTSTPSTIPASASAIGAYSGPRTVPRSTHRHSTSLAQSSTFVRKYVR